MPFELRADHVLTPRTLAALHRAIERTYRRRAAVEHAAAGDRSGNGSLDRRLTRFEDWTDIVARRLQPCCTRAAIGDPCRCP